MATIPVKIRRGTRAQLDGITLADSELGFTTDTKEVYCGDGSTNHLIGGVQFDLIGNRPAAGVPGRIFVGTDNGATYIDDGTNWNNVSSSVTLATISGDLDDIDDGSTYGKVLLTEISAGRVSRVSDGSNISTALQIRNHIDDTTSHFIINDIGAADDETWSSNKITAAIAAVSQGLDPQDSVISQTSLAVSVSPSLGDRYISTTTGTAADGGGAISAGNIYKWNGSTWDETAKSEGMHCWDETLNAAYVYNGTSWVKWSSTEAHNDMGSLQGGSATERYHMTAAQHTAVGNLSGSNTGDQSSSDFDHDDLSGLSGGLANDRFHLTEVQHDDLTDGGDSNSHYHAGDRARANHTGTQLAATISDFVTQVRANITVADSSSIDLSISDGEISADIILVDGGTFV